jgi:hypothetical protein
MRDGRLIGLTAMFCFPGIYLLIRFHYVSLMGIILYPRLDVK